MVEKTVIQKIIYYSKQVAELKMFKLHMQNTKELYLRLNIKQLRSSEFDEIIGEISNRISEFNKQIELLLKPIISNKVIYDSPSWALTIKEMQNGYVTLEPNGENGEKYVLFLSNFKDKQRSILEGTILPYNQVVHILGNISDVFKEGIRLPRYIAHTNPLLISIIKNGGRI